MGSTGPEISEKGWFGAAWELSSGRVPGLIPLGLPVVGVFTSKAIWRWNVTVPQESCCQPTSETGRSGLFGDVVGSLGFNFSRNGPDFPNWNTQKNINLLQRGLASNQAVQAISLDFYPLEF